MCVSGTREASSPWCVCVRYEGGIFTRVELAPDQPVWARNFIKGILNMLQLNLRQKGAIAPVSPDMLQALRLRAGKMSKMFWAMEVRPLPPPRPLPPQRPSPHHAPSDHHAPSPHNAPPPHHAPSPLNARHPDLRDPGGRFTNGRTVLRRK